MKDQAQKTPAADPNYLKSAGGQPQQATTQPTLAPGNPGYDQSNQQGDYGPGYVGSPGAGTSQPQAPLPAGQAMNGVSNPSLAAYLNSDLPANMAPSNPSMPNLPPPQAPGTGGFGPSAPPPSNGGFGPFPPGNYTGNASLYPAGGQPSPSGGNQYGPVQNRIDTSQVPSLVGGDALRGITNDARDAAYRTATGYLDPQWANDQKAMETKLANQGVMQNSEAWNKAMDDFGRQKQFAYGQAENSAFNQGLAAEGQTFGEGLSANQNAFGQAATSGGFTNAAQSQLATQGLTAQQIQEQLQAAQIAGNTSTSNVQAQLEAQRQQNEFQNSLTMRNQGINELLLQQQNPLSIYGQLNSGTGAQQPNFTTTPGSNMNPTDIASILNQAYQGQLTGYNAQTGAANSNNAAMASIIAAIICDRRLKKNVRCIGMHAIGVPLYVFDYLWGEPGMGVMADDVERVRPDAVVTLANGFKAVNMARL